MHTQAYEWMMRHGVSRPVTVLDIGGRNINGSPRACFPGASEYTVLDVTPGRDVDIQADASTWRPDPARTWDVVVCCEVFEHTAVWPQIVETAFDLLPVEGVFIATMAGPGRAEHSAYDGGTLRADEWYANVEPDDLWKALVSAGFVDVQVDVEFDSHDVRCTARRP